MAQNTLLIFLHGLKKITRKTKYYMQAKTEIKNKTSFDFDRYFDTTETCRRY